MAGPDGAASAPLLRVIGPDGAAAKELEPDLPVEELRRMYRTMVLVRTLDERALKLQRAGRIGFYVSCLGQEAAQVGSAQAFEPRDWIFPTYRDPAIPLHRGIRVVELLHQCFGNAKDRARGRQMPVHYAFRDVRFVSISSPIGTQITQAVGAAYAAKLRAEPVVVGAYLGDGATSSNDFHAGLNFAGVWKAPVVFLCENNQWAISCPSAKQTASETYAGKAVAYGMPGARVDGNDALAVYRATKEAVDRARRGEGPTLIEAVTYRMGSHSSSDDAGRYRPPAELEEWKKKDPIERFRLYLGKRRLWTEDFEGEVTAWAGAEVQKGIEEAEATPLPPIDTIFTDVYADLPPHLREQLEELKRAEAAGRGEEEKGEFPL
ncbi:MAG TPA: pyruvate dehydrogenase (acetyl-transferring) E1 component subunit alpha [Planctomycetota bacterium]|nr:pyruvate dehydrogenase (acetyl-transferring) E1 component subunit alpha [Planctomycetota bacterium]